MASKRTYKVIFHNQGKIFEVFARNVHQSGMLGFIEIEQLLFDQKTTVVVDPSEESLKAEFDGVKRVYIPVHSIIRIDEVEKQGHAKITKRSGSGDNVTAFPVYTPTDIKGTSD